MNAPELIIASPEEDHRANSLLGYYEAIEQASHDMLEAARTGDWDTVVRLEGACAVLIAQLKHAANVNPLPAEEIALKGRIMQRILRNDAEIRNLAEPWINELSRMTGHPDGERLH
ncbi:MAG TPA: flagellar protein FliT [Candidatus Aquabacterium excrementipullorum]|nr:flagellar protein FliT [Candidatus Aquabacterium excrementipullorum]